MRSFFIVALLCSSCLAVSDNNPKDAQGLKHAESSRGGKAKPEVDFDALEFKVTSAERSVLAAKSKAQLQEMEAQSKRQSAEQAVAVTSQALLHLEKVKIPTRLAQKDLDIARLVGRLEDSEAELVQIRAMYADEEFAESSKELVIRRSQRSVDLARAGLEMARAAREDLETFELATERESAAQKVIAAKQKLAAAKLRLEATVFEAKTKAMEADEALRKAKHALDQARAKAEGAA